MIPLKDMSPHRSVPVVTLLLIAANAVVFFHQLTMSPEVADSFIQVYGLVPAKMQQALGGRHYTLLEAFLPLVTSMFLHGGWMHIIGNMWFLWIFGAKVEDRLGPLAYLMFYFVCGIGSGAAQAIFSWGSKVPSIGASGAISGILGAYIVMFPASRILTLVPLFIFWFTARIPAFVFIGLWFVVQFFSGVSALGASGKAQMGGVAWWAHVGGFLIGLLMAKMFAGRPADSWSET